MTRPVAALLALLLGLAVAVPANAGSAPTVRQSAPAPANEFPRGWEGFHTYTEMSTEVAAVAAAHPNIVSRFSIGKSYQGRDLWAVKVSDNVGVDEAEPEVLFDGLHHAREHMSLEMTLAIFHWLVDGYGTDTTITGLVDSREIWIVFAVNPDGAEYDIAGGRYHLWRKNRQPTPRKPYIGTDLNRNYDYRWGCCAGSSTNPANLMYRGPRAFSAPETRAFRDFVNSRVVDGRQQIRTAITFHTSGRLVMWPYGYTYVNVPSDMTRADQAVFVTMGKAMAARSRYRPMQASDLYISAGTTRDWLYGRHRIFSYTFELTTGWYPDDSTIGPETRRNRWSVLHLIARAGCPYAATGQARVYCGPFWDDFEIERGWAVNPGGTDTATAGAWQRGNPAPTSSSGAKQLGTTPSGSADLVTGRAPGSSAEANDLDGSSSIRSTEFDLPAGGTYSVRFRYALGYRRSSAADYLRMSLVASDGTRATLFERTGTSGDVDAAWITRTVPVPASFAGLRVRVLVEAGDLAGDSLVEAAVDDLSVMRTG